MTVLVLIQKKSSRSFYLRCKKNISKSARVTVFENKVPQPETAILSVSDTCVSVAGTLNMNMPFCFTETFFVLSSHDAITEQLNYEFQTELTTFPPTAQINRVLQYSFIITLFYARTHF